MWILRDQNIILTVNWDKNDEIINMDFKGFKQQIQKTFSQTLSPQSRPYNQGLVVIEKVLQFVNMDSDLTFLEEASVDLKRVNTTLYKIISQELNFLDQLTSFREMLQSARVFTNKSTKIKCHAFPGVTVE